ncbi:hsp70-Hsp90 organizing protein 1-like [Cimex lectularius]|uniref:Uncharacterized protein n=1 Tax=Cimex lectularius TaxID=79782 RepID=A0A8I6RG70_CIMLE|nr:hsp70-Hsp90 organizing protein 1-like [Cimex lectularius]
MTAEEVQTLKEKGNACMKENKYAEAILHYTQGIVLDPKNYILFSNRSFAFLKLSQFYHAYEDAIETIRLNPLWAKGYFRKGEVEAATFQYEDALLNYKCALEHQPGDAVITEAMKRVTTQINKDKRANEQVPWLGAGVGIIIGVIIVIADQLFTNTPSISHPIVMAILTISIAVIGFGLAKGYRYYVECCRKGLLDPPPDLLKEMNAKQENGVSGEKSGHQRYSKAQARLKLRKGRTS